MVLLKSALVISFVLLLCSGFIEAGIPSIPFIPTLVIDRFVANNINYTLQPVDVTSFLVNRKVVLTEFTLPKVFTYSEYEESNVNYLEANVTIYETDPATGTKEEIYEAMTSLNSEHERNITFHTPIDVIPGFLYEIELKTRREKLFFKNVKEAGIYEIKKIVSLLKVNIMQHNQTIDDNKYFKASHGAVSRLKFAWKFLGKIFQTSE